MKMLQNDDLRPGLIVIGMGCFKDHERPIYGDGMFAPPTAVMVSRDNAYKGRIYRIDAVDLPFIVMTQLHSGNIRITPTSWDGHPSTHDTRDGFRWGECSNEILKSLGMADLCATDAAAAKCGEGERG